MSVTLPAVGAADARGLCACPSAVVVSVCLFMLDVRWLLLIIHVGLNARQA